MMELLGLTEIDRYCSRVTNGRAGNIPSRDEARQDLERATVPLYLA